MTPRTYSATELHLRMQARIAARRGDAASCPGEAAPTTSCGHPFVARRDLPGRPCFPCAQSQAAR